jgi:hypothetical protein
MVLGWFWDGFGMVLGWFWDDPEEELPLINNIHSELTD